MFRRLAVVLCLGVCARGAAKHDPWLRIESAHFELFTTAGERRGRDLATEFERVRRFFLEASGSNLPSMQPVRIIAFRSGKEYAPYRPAKAVTAHYQPGMEHDFIVMQGAARENFPVAVHEYTHLLIRQSGLRVPLWLNEGLAELYSNLEPAGTRIVVGKVIPGRARALMRQPWIPLAAVISADRESPLFNDPARTRMFYAESWILVHMVNLSPEYRPRLKAMLSAMAHSDSGTAFREAYGKPVERIEEDLKAYIRRGTLAAAVFDLEFPKTADRPSIDPNASVPARLALAELLANTPGKIERARAAYAELARAYPERWEVEAGLAGFAAHERQDVEALRHYARSVELGCSDARVYLAYGRALRTAGRNADAVQALRTAVHLSPDSPEARLELDRLLRKTKQP